MGDRRTGCVGGRRALLRAARGKLARTSVLGVGMLALVLAPSASASTLSHVVREPGTIAGQPYRYWMTRTWKLYFSSLAPGAKACTTVRVHGRAVTLVGNFSGGRSTCHVPAGSAVYVNEYTTHCSTLPGEHDGFGASVAELRKCSLGVNRSTVKVGISAWLDGNAVPLFGKDFWMGTLTFPVKAKRAQAAAWGWSLLLKPLPQGSHTVRCRVTTPAKRLEAESIVTLHVA